MASDNSSQFTVTAMDTEAPGNSSDSWINIVVALKAILFVAGFLGNLTVIFVITILKEYKKTAHW